jgi:hypothetical protein
MVVDAVDSSSLGGALENRRDDMVKGDVKGQMEPQRTDSDRFHALTRALRMMVEELGA